jgi:protein-S-isoprenylcysteine O-methyltransferase Ste14
MALIEEMEKQGNFLFRYRGILPIIILLVGLVFFLYSEWLRVSLGRPELPFDRFDQLLCIFFALLGFGIRIYTVGHTPKNTSGRNTAGQLADELNTSGIYSIVRHPLYLGNFFMWLGMAVLTMNFWFITSFIFLFWVYYERIMLAEEQFLNRKFGSAYNEWASRTPAFFPRFRNWRKSALEFNWIKVLKKEKTGLLAVFTVIFLFDILQDSIRNKLLVLELNFWSVALLVSLIFYVSIKLAKYRLKVLKEEQ